jgi:hypothetical protein
LGSKVEIHFNKSDGLLMTCQFFDVHVRDEMVAELVILLLHLRLSKGGD